MHLTPTELWLSMGPIARAVMILLAAMSCVSLAVAIERFQKLARAARESADFLAAWRPAVEARGIDIAASESAAFPHSYVAYLVREASQVIAANREAGTWLEALDRTTRRIVLATGVDAKRGLGVLATIGSTAPFVGLFGTVVGVVSAFHTISVTGQGGLGSVSAGIAEALVATALGILVAIPALWLFNALSQRIQRLVTELECTAEELAVAALAEANAVERSSPRGRFGREA